jgi:hypothetical protein
MATPNVAMPLEPLLALARRQASVQGMNEGSTLSDREFASMVGVTSRTVARWRAAGNVLPWPAADEAATALGMHPINIWGWEWVELDADVIDGLAPKKVYRAIERAMERIGEVLAAEAANHDHVTLNVGQVAHYVPV